MKYALFETALGTCGLAWSDRGIACVQLPEATAEATRERLASRAPGGVAAEPEAWVGDAIERLKAHVAGTPQDLSDIPLDLTELPPFHQRVVAAARTVGPGRTVTYGELAALAGSPGGARAVGQAMATNRFSIIVPCHRVLAAGQRPGGFTAHGGLATKQRLLAAEGVALRRRPETLSLFSGRTRLPFDAARAAQALRANDERLAALMDRVGPFRLELEEMHSPFESLAEAIIYQQLSGKAAATIAARTCALFDATRFPTPGELLDASEDRLRSAGLSRPKIAALKDLAEHATAGRIPSVAEMARMADDEIVERLVAVRGIGRWTVEMMLIFRLGRPDVLPLTDYGIRKGFAILTRSGKLPRPEKLARRGERWRPFRTVASWYLWRALELKPG